jgi:hypothetical protein
LSLAPTYSNPPYSNLYSEYGIKTYIYHRLCLVDLSILAVPTMDYTAFLKYREGLLLRLTGAIERIKSIEKVDNNVWNYMDEDDDGDWLVEYIEDMDIYRELFEEGKDVFEDRQHFDEIVDRNSLAKIWLSRIKLSKKIQNLIDDFKEAEIQETIHIYRRNIKRKKKKNTTGEDPHDAVVRARNALWKELENQINAKLSS